MEHQESESAPKRRLEKRSGKRIFLGVLLVLLVAGAASIYLLAPDKVKDIFDSNATTVPVEDTVPGAASRDQENRPDSLTGRLPDKGENQPASPARRATSGQKEDRVPQDVSPGGGSDVPSSSAAGAGQDRRNQSHCQERADTIEAFFDTLDTRPYMHEFDLGQKSSEYFPRLLQKLIDNPPVVSGETDDLFTILQNTAHFFRLLGKRNILLLKGILDREKPTFETVLADFYELTSYPECLKERFGLSITKDPLYQYAAFFLNTMGGRLYLFRRDSMSRMIVNYYAILIIEQANREGRNKYGIEIDRPISSLIDEIESSNIDLKLRERYLDTLYDLKEKYQ